MTFVDLSWTAPADDGGGEILYYEIRVIEEDGTATPFERTDGPETMWRVRGLAFYHRYGFRHRAVYAAGPGPQSPIFYMTPTRPVVRVIPPGARIPLDDHDRQSLIVRIAGQDCRIRIFWQPSDPDGGSWWGSLEVPIDTPVVTSRRLGLNIGLLDRIEDVLPGNIVLRELGGDGLEPQRDAFASKSHGLFFEPRRSR